MSLEKAPIFLPGRQCDLLRAIFSQTIWYVFYPLTPTQQTGQTHSNNLSAIGDKLFECV